MRGLKAVVIVGAMALGTSPVLAAQDGPARGKQLHQKHCTACHGTEVYTREDRRIQSLQMLQQQVARCNKATGANLSEADRTALVQYLNRSFYGF